MDCPACSGRTRVVETRKHHENARYKVQVPLGTVYRRRECTVCYRRMATQEHVLREIEDKMEA